MIAVDRHPKGPRLYVGGLRVHHGLTGAALAAAGAKARRRPIGRALIVLGATLIAHDRKDFPFSPFDNHDRS